MEPAHRNEHVARMRCPDATKASERSNVGRRVDVPGTVCMFSRDFITDDRPPFIAATRERAKEKTVSPAG